MKVYTLESTQSLPIDMKTAWDFLSDPRNLSKITPPSMGFNITSKNLPDAMYKGMIITYTVKPLLGIPVTWVTEITEVNEPYFFIDNQKIGPYAMWHHQHNLTEIDGGVKMDDIIHYALPFGFLGGIMRELIVKNKLKSIFDYRKIVLEKEFGKM